MDPFTLLALIFGGAYFLHKRAMAAAPVVLAPPSNQPVTQPNGVVLYTGNLPAARGIEDTSASPIEQSGYIPPYVPDIPSSAVALGCSCDHSLGRAKTVAPNFLWR